MAIYFWHAPCKESLCQRKHHMHNQFESTYGMLVHSEEKGRSILEILVYGMATLSVVLSIFQFAEVPVKISAPEVEPCVACHSTTAHSRVGS